MNYKFDISLEGSFPKRWKYSLKSSIEFWGCYSFERCNTIQGAYRAVVKRISESITETRLSGQEPPKKATVTTGKHGNPITLKEYQELQRFLSKYKKDGFPEFSFPTRKII
jgi:hypothetical protein